MKHILTFINYIKEEYLFDTEHIKQTVSKEDINIFFKKLKHDNPYLIIDYKIFKYQNIIYIFIPKIIIKKTKHNKGYGTYIMQEILKFSDENIIPITLTPSDVFGSDINRLINFYTRLGFIENNNSDIQGELIYIENIDII